MPRYTFSCQNEACNLRFEKTLKLGEHLSEPCPSCKADAPRLWSEDGFGFKFAQGGSATANSGVHSQDYPTADMAVGKSAEKRWEFIRARSKVKSEARRQSGTTALIRQDGPGYTDYEPMTDVGVKARDRLVDKVDAVVKASRQKKA